MLFAVLRKAGERQRDHKNEKGHFTNACFPRWFCFQTKWELNLIVVDDEVWENVIALQNTADTALLERVNYEGFARYWPSANRNPSSTKYEIERSKWLNDSLKIVFSKTSTDKIEAAKSNLTTIKPTRGEPKP